jgi:phage terminase small subunit
LYSAGRAAQRVGAKAVVENELVTRTEKGEDGEPVKVLMLRVTIVDADKISDEAAAAVAEVSQTVNGALRVKMHDKHAALVSLGRHLGLLTM